MAGLGGAALTTSVAARDTPGAGEVRRDSSEGAGEADPHTVATFRAVVDAIVPGDDAPGGLAVDLERFLLFSFNSFVPAEPGGPENTGVNQRYAGQFADTLDYAASELVARGENEDEPDPTRFPGGGPFASLSRDDRFRAVALLEGKELAQEAGEEDGLLNRVSNYPGFVKYQIMGLNAFTQFGFYNEWAGYTNGTACPTERNFAGVDAVPSFEQTGYPGPAKGYAALRGYEVRQFEDDWDCSGGTDASDADGTDSEQTPGTAGDAVDGVTGGDPA